MHDAGATAGTVIEALSDPTRRRIVTLLSGGPKRAGELAAEVGMSAPAMSRHLRVLLSALVIADERLDEDARARVFRLKPESIKTARAWLDQLVPGPTPGSTGAGSTAPDDGETDDEEPGCTGPGSTGPDNPGPDNAGPGSTRPGSTGPGRTGQDSTGPGGTGPSTPAPANQPGEDIDSP
jgi:DNA-binding transcriptional ArsR family regulator